MANRACLCTAGPDHGGAQRHDGSASLFEQLGEVIGIGTHVSHLSNARAMWRSVGAVLRGGSSRKGSATAEQIATLEGIDSATREIIYQRKLVKRRLGRSHAFEKSEYPAPHPQ